MALPEWALGIFDMDELAWAAKVNRPGLYKQAEAACRFLQIAWEHQPDRAMLLMQRAFSTAIDKQAIETYCERKARGADQRLGLSAVH